MKLELQTLSNKNRKKITAFENKIIIINTS